MLKEKSQEKQKKNFFKEINIYYKVILSIVATILGLISIITLTKIVIQYFSSSDIFSLYYGDILFGIFCIYYASWLYGLGLDLKTEESTFFSAPNAGKITKKGQILMISLAVIFCIIVIYKGNIQMVSGLLFFFLFVNYLSWIYLKRLIENTIKNDLIKYQELKNFIKYEKLVVVEEWLFGRWQTIRFIFGFIFIIGINLYVNSPLYITFPQIFDIHCQNFIPIFLIALYILMIEGIILFFRMQRETALELLSDLEGQYLLVEKDSDID